MKRLHIRTSPTFDRKLARFMRARGIKNKSIAIRTVIEEALERAEKARQFSIDDLYGSAKLCPQTPRSNKR
jgi:hypothetical protein